MATHELAGQPAPPEALTDIPRLVSRYYLNRPDVRRPDQQISFGTSGHRGTSLDRSFNEAHILAITQAVCDYRRSEGIDGPLYVGKDTHALSEPALATVVEVLAANDVDLVLQEGLRYTPTPVISHAILTYNQGRESGLADGIIITPSHNPPDNGGIKYNPPLGGPAPTPVTRRIEERANAILANDLDAVHRIPFNRALEVATTHYRDYIGPYVTDLDAVIDMEAIASAGISIGVDPMGGSGIEFWGPIAEEYGLDLEVVNPVVDPSFSFMTLDKDGVIRMDCSSSYAMAGLIEMKDDFDLAFGNDPDYDRHGIVTPDGGLMNPNHYLSVAVDYLFRHRPQWDGDAAVGKTLVSSSLIDRVVRNLGRSVAEVPVGFKWFVEGLRDGSYGFGGEESAGASFLRTNGMVWTTDKDGFIMDLLAAEILAVTGKDPHEHYERLTAELGSPVYERIDRPATAEQKKALKQLTPEMVEDDRLAGEPIEQKLTKAPANQAPIGGLKVVTENGWFAARPSGTEDIYKIYTESFKGPKHLEEIQEDAQRIVQRAFAEAA